MQVGYIRYWPTNLTRDALMNKMDELPVDKIMIELSSTIDQLHQYISSLTHYDVLIVYDLFTLGESVNDIIQTVNLLKEEKIKLFILDVELDEQEVGILFNNQIVQNIVYKYLCNTLQSIEESSKTAIRSRQSQGIMNVKKHKNSRSQGRPKKYSRDAEDPEDREIYYLIRSLLQQGRPISEIAGMFGISRNTIYRIKDEMNEE